MRASNLGLLTCALFLLARFPPRHCILDIRQRPTWPWQSTRSTVRWLLQCHRRTSQSGPWPQLRQGPRHALVGYPHAQAPPSPYKFVAASLPSLSPVHKVPVRLAPHPSGAKMLLGKALGKSNPTYICQKDSAEWPGKSMPWRAATSGSIRIDAARLDWQGDAFRIRWLNATKWTKHA